MPLNKDPIELIRNLEDSASLLDVLIQVENFIDELDCYAFHGWSKGVIVEGPTVKRYWVKIILEYKYKDMPDPIAALRLTKHGAKVYYERAKREVPFKDRVPNLKNNETDDTKKPEQKTKPELEDIWLIHVLIPRRYFNDIANETLPVGDDDLDMEEVSDAVDQGIEDGEDAIDTNGTDQNTEAEGGEMPNDISGGDLDDLF
jgi:hypothetical protein